MLALVPSECTAARAAAAAVVVVRSMISEVRLGVAKKGVAVVIGLVSEMAVALRDRMKLCEQRPYNAASYLYQSLSGRCAQHLDSIPYA